ncbi:MAG: LpxL/LpxP family acyltransferase [Burkholderiales bacterium]|nr:Lipid A biosynthesis lauroyl acyltransferase [Betaproteobacteria bacterium MOLA814]
MNEHTVKGTNQPVHDPSGETGPDQDDTAAAVHGTDINSEEVDASLDQALGPLWARVLAPLPLPVIRGLGRAAGYMLYALAGKRRHIVATNLKLCFPDQPMAHRKRLAREVFVAFSQSLLDRAWLWHGSAQVVAERLHLSGNWQHLIDDPDQAQVLFAPHFVGLDAGWTALNLHLHGQRSFSTIYAKQNKPRLDAWIVSGRSRFGQPALLARQGLGKSIVQVLRGGAALYLLPDMDLGARDAVFVPFFGVPAATVTSLPRLAAMGKTGVTPVTTRMTSAGYNVHIGASWPNYPSGDHHADAATMNRHLETMVQAMPHQYYWVHKRFKTRPEGEAGLY